MFILNYLELCALISTEQNTSGNLKMTWPTRSIYLQPLQLLTQAHGPVSHTSLIT